MADKAWKATERDVAGFFYGERDPLSGRNGKHTAADVIHETLFIECKLRKKHRVITLWMREKPWPIRKGKRPWWSYENLAPRGKSDLVVFEHDDPEINYDG